MREAWRRLSGEDEGGKNPRDGVTGATGGQAAARPRHRARPASAEARQDKGCSVFGLVSNPAAASAGQPTMSCSCVGVVCPAALFLVVSGLWSVVAGWFSGSCSQLPYRPAGPGRAQMRCKTRPKGRGPVGEPGRAWGKGGQELPGGRHAKSCSRPPPQWWANNQHHAYPALATKRITSQELSSTHTCHPSYDSTGPRCQQPALTRPPSAKSITLPRGACCAPPAPTTLPSGKARRSSFPRANHKYGLGPLGFPG